MFGAMANSGLFLSVRNRNRMIAARLRRSCKVGAPVAAR